MIRRPALLLILILCVGTPALANDLQNLLATPDLTIGTVELAKDDLNEFYAARAYAPAWNFTGPENIRALDAFLDSVAQVVDYHGLSREDYAIDLMRQLSTSTDDNDRLKLELLITDTLLQLAHDLHGDYGELDDLYVGWNFNRSEVDIPLLLNTAITTHGLNEFINGLTPQNPNYAALARALRTYRDFAKDGGWPTIDAGPTLRPKDRSPRVAQVRARLVAENFLPKTTLTPDQNQLFDDTLRQAVMDWQLQNGLDADGNVGSGTLATLNVPVTERIDQIRANMERWRHMPDDFPPARYVMINIASASIDIVEDGKTVYRGPVVIGRVDRKTPFIRSSIRSMIVNPSWHVPTKIAQKDILPKLRRDPHYLEKLGFVISGHDGDPHGEDIDWASMPTRAFNLRLRQSPGDMNSLGRLKFDFDNDFAVYMHGTPHQELFKKNQRNFSSGCVRLRDPEQVAEVLLAANSDPWDVKKIEDEIATDKTRWVGLAKPMPIYILYWTVFVDESGKLNFRKDAYNYDGMLMNPPAAPTDAGKP